MLAIRETKEKVQVSREEEQEKRLNNYSKDGECLEVSQLDEERYRVDNLITCGVYFVTLEGQEKTCTCPDYQSRCISFNPPVECKHIIGVNNWITKKRQQQAKKDGKHNFEPHNYLTKIKGKDYLEVKYRLHWFRLEHSIWDIRTEIVNLDLEKGIALVRADIYDEKGNHRSSGLKMEIKSSFGDYAEKAETGAIGRALAAFGYGTLQTFDLEEGIEKGRIVDSPVSLSSDKGNGKTMSGMGKEHEELPQENKQDVCQEYKGNNGGNGGNGNGTDKASLKQVRYLKDLCQELNVRPAIEL